MQIQELFEALKKRFGDQVLELATPASGEPSVTVSAAAVQDVALFCREDSSLEFDQLMCLSGVDYPPEHLAVVYHMHSSTKHHRLILKAMVPREDPKLPTVSRVWRTANWHEREAYDLFGIVFTGHANLRRILLPQDWVGYPLRKDYVFPTEYRGIKCHD
ncbi:MAG: NADH-quinone oxidoreductase subunit C [Candidatus Wallbacteria bacterium]|nr:NADH-quinone oxidoreductase subunit C [Candidatus Wallbacteria bacterium]